MLYCYSLYMYLIVLPVHWWDILYMMTEVWSTPLFLQLCSCFVVTVYLLNLFYWFLAESSSDTACYFSDGHYSFFVCALQYDQVLNQNFEIWYYKLSIAVNSLFLEQLKVSQHQNDNSSGLISELQGMF